MKTVCHRAVTPGKELPAEQGSPGRWQGCTVPTHCRPEKATIVPMKEKPSIKVIKTKPMKEKPSIKVIKTKARVEPNGKTEAIGRTGQ